MKVYLASNYYNEEQRQSTQYLVSSITHLITDLNLYLPQEDEELYQKAIHNTDHTYQEDTNHLLSSNVLVVHLNDCDLDRETAYKIGVFAGSLDTLEQLQLRHTPKYIIVYKECETAELINSYLDGLLHKYGIVVSSVKDLTHLLTKIRQEYYT